MNNVFWCSMSRYKNCYIIYDNVYYSPENYYDSLSSLTETFWNEVNYEVAIFITNINILICTNNQKWIILVYDSTSLQYNHEISYYIYTQISNNIS